MHVANVVNDQQGLGIQLLDHGRQVVAGLGLLQQLHQACSWEEAEALVLLHRRHRDGDGQVDLTDPTGAKQQHILCLLQPGGVPGQVLQVLPVMRLQMPVIKVIDTLLPWEASILQKPLLACDLAVFQLLLRERKETGWGFQCSALLAQARGCQWLRKRASLSSLSSSGSAASTAAGRGMGEEVVIGGEQMLGNHGIRKV